MSPRRRSPRPLSDPLERLRGRWEPDTPVARVQSTWTALADIWPQVVGEYVAERARPVSVKNGVLTVSCSEAVVSAELDAQSMDVLGRLNAQLTGVEITRLRCITGG
ncbi:MAG TPA: DUF721 domain-containing protein [Solirubrobacteraceae bacterium]|nr:DUF721 domain-containing protein [Solirubrobacteraceae bacterium]